MKYIFILLVFLMNGNMLYAQKIMPLYADGIPNSIAGKDQENVTDNNGVMIIHNVSQPTLTAYLPPPALANGAAVIICPGGGYEVLAAGHEGSDVAKELNKAGIAAFVLKYRLPKDAIMVNKEIGPLQDAQQAIKTVRSRAKEWDIDPGKIGIMGFSAGGHLAATAGTRYDEAFISNADNTNLRPDFLILIYPVVSFQDSLTHNGSRMNLLGEKVSQQKKDYYSNEGNVNHNTPTTFLVHASNDSAVKVANSTAFYQALVQHHVPAELHIYEKGGHGFGMIKNNTTTDAWFNSLADWLLQINLLQQKNKTETAPSEEANKKAEELFHNDWANRKKYEWENKNLKSVNPGEKRIVFMGNSITEFWKITDSSFFKDKPYINRGISGQTTPQMLLRFREDVINLKPSVVVILAGINDIAENTGPTTLENIFGNLISMMELAKAGKIKVVLCSVLPAYDFPWKPGLAPAEKVVRLNAMLKNYADKNNIVYANYYSAMVDKRKGLDKKFTDDGVHPTLAGYKIMEPLLEKAIAEALKRK
jgi:acetyl esterase/lipase/lysophospholipase L1-like esterase